MDIDAASSGTDRVRLPTLVVGPENNGRGYRLLASSPDVPDGNWIIDLPMMLLEWAKLERTEPFVACLPVDSATVPGGVVVVRARFFRRLPIGPVAYLHAACLTAEQCEAIGWQTEQVVGRIPDPDESTAFAGAPLDIAIAPAPSRPWPRLDLAWTSRMVSVEPPIGLEEVLVRALASVDPPEQRQKVLSWATTAELPARGGLNPLRQCRLIVARDGSAPAVVGFLPYRIHADGTSEGEPAPVPPPRRAWEDFRHLLSADPALDANAPELRWRAAFSDETPRAVVAELLRAAAGLFPSDAMITLLAVLTHHEDPAFREAGQSVLGQYAGAAAARGLLARPLVKLLQWPDRDAQVIALLPHVDDAVLEQLSGAEFGQLLFTCVRHSEKTGVAALGDLAPRIAHFAVVYARRCETETLAIDPLLAIVHLLHAESRDELGSMLTARFLEAARAAGRTAVAQFTRLLAGPVRAQFARGPRTRGDAIRILGAMTGAIKQLEANHG